MWVVTYSGIWIGKFVLSPKFEVGIGTVVILSIVVMIKVVIWNNDRKELIMAKVQNEDS